MDVSATTLESICPNCGAVLGGPYCSQCGQKRLPSGDLSMRRFYGSIAEEAGGLRGRFKTLTSLGALARPGYLTTEYLAGRRQSHLGPVKVFLVCATIFFFGAGWAGFNLESLLAQDPTSELAEQVVARRAERALDPALFAARFDLRVKTVLPIATTITVAFVAALLTLLTRRRGMPFGAHVVFALHFVAITFPLTMLLGAARRIPGFGDLAGNLGLALLVLYLVFALRRVYPGPWRATVAQAASVFALTMASNFAVNWMTILLTLRLI